MSYWEEDVVLLRELADELPAHRRRLLEIARDLDNATPDGEFLEDLARKIPSWVENRTLPTEDFAEELADSLLSIALYLKKDPGQ